MTSALTLGARGLAVRSVTLLGFLVLARVMTRSDIGAIAVGTSILFLGNFLVDAGLGIALVRHPEEPSRKDLAAVSALQFGVAGVAFLIVLALSPLLGKAGVVTALMVGSLMFTALKVPCIVMLERRLNYGPILLADIGEATSFVILSVGLVFAGMGPTGVGLAAIGRGAVGALVITFRSPVGFVLPRFSRSRIRRVLSFGVNVQGVSLIVMTRDQVLNLAAAAISGLVTLSIWSVANRFIAIPGLLFESLSRVIVPALSRLHALGEDLRFTLERTTQRLAVMTGAVVAVLAGAGPALIPLLLGKRWTAAAQVLPMLLTAILLATPVAIVGVGYLYATGEARAVLRANLWSAGAGVAVGLSALPFIGVEALGAAAIANAALEALIVSRVVARRCGALLLRELRAPLVAASASGGSGFGIAERLGSAPLALVAATVWIVLSYGLTMRLIHRTAFVDTTTALLRGIRNRTPAPGDVGLREG